MERDGEGRGRVHLQTEIDRLARAGHGVDGATRNLLREAARESRPGVEPRHRHRPGRRSLPPMHRGEQPGFRGDRSGRAIDGTPTRSQKERKRRHATQRIELHRAAETVAGDGVVMRLERQLAGANPEGRHAAGLNRGGDRGADARGRRADETQASRAR